MNMLKKHKGNILRYLMRLLGLDVVRRRQHVLLRRLDVLEEEGEVDITLFDSYAGSSVIYNW